ncbi:MAG: BNR-4 repeat-containing protein [Paludibacteraceae bacterium]
MRKKIIFFISILISSSIFSQTNLIENWDGNGDTNTTTSYPDKYGWAVTVGTFNYANSTSGLRYVDVTSSSNPIHYLSGSAYAGRLMMVRWDGAGSTSLESVYSYPVNLQTGKRYKLTFIYEWWNNASVPTYTVGIGTSKDGSNPIVTNTYACSSTKNLLQKGELSFHITTGGTYYLTIKGNNLAVLGAIGELSMVEVPAILESNVTSINLNYYNTSQTFNISPNGSTDPISLAAPTGVSLSTSTLPYSGGTIIASSTDSSSVSGNITIRQGTDVLNIPVVASFPEDFIQSGKIDTLTVDGAWCWFNDPRAIYHKGIKEQTYFTWITRVGDIYIASYNHQTGEYLEKMIYPKLEADDHDVPAIFFRKDGRIILYFSKHTTAPAHRFISTNPEDITSWGTDYQFGENVTYPYPFQVGDSIYVLYRGLNWHPTLIVSKDNGETLGTPMQIIAGGGARPYARYCQDKTGAIHMAYTTGHPRDVSNNKIYYACFKNGKFYRANGTLIKDFEWGTNPLNIDNNDAETVYNATNGKGWIWDITVDADNNPVMVFATFPTDTDHRYYYARWTGTSWYQKQLTNGGKWFPQTPAGTTEPEPNYSGGISLDYDDPSVVYLSKPVKDVFEIFKFTTPDKGITWDSIAVTWNTPKEYVNVRPIVPRHHKKGFFDVLWMRGKYVYYTNYQTSIVYKMDSVSNDIDSIKLNPSILKMYQSNSTTITPVFYPFNTKDKTLTWVSSNTNIATVNNGTVTAIAPGDATVTATASNGKSATVQVTVLVPNYISNAFFDFGTATSPIASGAIQITESTVINDSYGWLPNNVVYSRDRGSGTDELRDFMLASTAATFGIFVNNGTYHIVVKQGDLSYLHDNMNIAVNGETKVSGVNSALGAYTTSEFDVTTANNRLDFTFSDGGGSDVNWVVNSLKITFTTSVRNILSDDDIVRKATSFAIFDLSGRIILSEKLNGRKYREVLQASAIKRGYI